MSKQRIKTTPNLIETSPAHQAAIASGKEYQGSWQYNVADHFKDKSQDQIRQSLKETALPFAVLCENIISDFNMSSLFRNANGFNAKEIFYLGDKRYDKRGAQGVYNYSKITWLPTIDDLIKLKEQYVFIAIDNIAGSVPIFTYNWPANALMVFGSEGVGITPFMQGLCDVIVSIPMIGSVRSFNCASAGGMAMYDYVSKYATQHLNKISSH